ncbi:MAG TPA: UDP-N-acetylmuramate dehydrogenase [Polyangiaceae bacterium]|nr:UDP-N-acetylmuramate dehydrogenase [Polyangiaceae bacterium]
MTAPDERPTPHERSSLPERPALSDRPDPAERPGPDELPALAGRTTLGVGGPPRAFVRAGSERALVAAVDACVRRGEPYFVLGGGSNVVASDEGFAGTVVAVEGRGLDIRRAPGGGAVLVEAAAGEPWDDLVARCVGEGLAGLECLSGIPGLVGATPIQNVGAYGQEVSDVIESVRAYDPASGRVEALSAEACGFAYRDSAFKREGPGRRVVLSVVFRLRAGPPSPPRYAELARALDGAALDLGRVREAVIALRRSKSMVVDPGDPDSRSAGSFFTNPVLEASALGGLRGRLEAAGVLAPGEALPSFDAGPGRVKVAAAWLIERAGVKKGERFGGAAVSRAHALAIVNRGGASAADVVGLARHVRARVYERCGVLLEPEPVFVGFGPEPLGRPG